MRKIVFNTCWGGYSLSCLALKHIYELKNPGKDYYFYIKCFEEDKEHWYPTLYKIVKTNEDLIDKNGPLYVSEKNLGDSFRLFDYSYSLEAVKKKYNLTKDGLEIIKNAMSFESYRSYLEPIYQNHFERHDPDLVKTIEDLGDKANGYGSKLAIAEIEDDELYDIEDYDGEETIVTQKSVLNRNWK